jgi:hypothetical protein
MRNSNVISKEMEEIINQTFSGLMFFYRDAAIDESLVSKYEPDSIIVEKGKGFKGIKSIYFLIIVFTFLSCGPQSKESYLKRYDSFIEEVGKNRSQYTAKDWEKKNEEFNQLSDEWYKKFKDDFTWREELKLTAHKVKYNYYIISKESSSFFKELFGNPDVEKIKSQIKFYVDNQMKEDIDLLVKEAKKVGKDVEEIVTQTLKNLGVNVNKPLNPE